MNKLINKIMKILMYKILSWILVGFGALILVIAIPIFYITIGISNAEETLRRKIWNEKCKKENLQAKRI